MNNYYHLKKNLPNLETDLVGTKWTIGCRIKQDVEMWYADSRKVEELAEGAELRYVQDAASFGEYFEKAR